MKRIIVVLLVCVLLVSCLSGCKEFGRRKPIVTASSSTLI